jgi:hypothetical protein
MSSAMTTSGPPAPMPCSRIGSRSQVRIPTRGGRADGRRAHGAFATSRTTSISPYDADPIDVTLFVQSALDR